MAQRLPLDLPGHRRIAGVRKKRLVLAAAALAVAVVIAEALWPLAYSWLRGALLGWRI